MYITNKTKRYPCTGYNPTENDVSFFGVEGLTLPLMGEIKLSSEDNDLVLAIQNCGDYARQVYIDNVLTLTSAPEPTPQPVPEPQPQPPSIADIVEMMIDHETRLSLSEMGVK